MQNFQLCIHMTQYSNYARAQQLTYHCTVYCLQYTDILSYMNRGVVMWASFKHLTRIFSVKHNQADCFHFKRTPSTKVTCKKST